LRIGPSDSELDHELTTQETDMRRITRTCYWLAGALVAALAGVALAAPTSAKAAVTIIVNGDTLTVTSDQEADTIGLAAAGGVITVNRQATTLAADDNAKIIVNAGDGADTVDASALGTADYSALTVNGGNGDDLLTGGSDNDHLLGDGGNDRVIGFKGNDDLEGGDGNDVLVWNNGDNTDVMDGDAGADEVEINGAPTAGDVFTADPNAGRVLFTRANLVPFTVDFSAERLTVNGLGGDDTFNGAAGLAPLTLLSLNGGFGDDSLSGGDGPDLISGGDGNDKLDGGGGDDRVVGDRGSDRLSGSDGDDALVWNNGDGSDTADGNAGFDHVEINGSPTAGDAFTVRPNGARAAIDRTNLVPFTVDFDAEALTVNAGGGDDQLTVSPGLAGLLVRASGESGNDSLTGAEEADSLVGGAGNDTLTGGGSSDLLDGQDGDDRLLARDGHGDLVRGGTGNDSAQTDAITVDAVDGVETIDATPPPPAPDTTALLPILGHITVVRNHGHRIAQVPLSCPAAETGGCRTTVTLTTARTIRLGRVRAALVLGSRSVNLKGGQRLTLSIPLAVGVATLARHGKLSTRVEIATRDAAGNAASRRVTVNLRIPR
jgi:Ca2+-binding RTX toxin-like protein